MSPYKTTSPLPPKRRAARHAYRLALDASAGNRHFDENGFLHVAVSHISKETVNPYYGREIPGWEALGLDPERIYHGWRAGAELAAGAASFNGLPLLLDHYVDSAAAPQKEHRVGSLGTDAAFRAPYLDNSLIVTDAAAIAAIESGAARELSAAYMYDPVFAPGVFNGEAYDFVMTNIRGNHVALVQEGRAGPDVVVADARLGKTLLNTGKKTVKQRFLEEALINEDFCSLPRKAAPGAAQCIKTYMSSARDGLTPGAGKKTIKQRFLNPQPQRTTLMSILNRLTRLARDNAPVNPGGVIPALSGPPAGNDEDFFAAPTADYPGLENPGLDDLDPDVLDPSMDPSLDEDLADFTTRMDELLAEIPNQDMAAALRAMILTARNCPPDPALTGDDGEGEGELDPALAALLSGDEGELDALFSSNGSLSGDDDLLDPLNPAAQDRRPASDAALRRARTGLSRHFRAINVAARAVRPLIGEVDPLAFDSASAIYRQALVLSGCNPNSYPASAWRGMCEMLKNARPGLLPPALARDRAARLAGPFKNLTTIRVEG